MAKTWDQLAESAAAFVANIPDPVDLTEINDSITAIKQEMADTAEALDPTPAP